MKKNLSCGVVVTASLLLTACGSATDPARSENSSQGALNSGVTNQSRLSAQAIVSKTVVSPTVTNLEAQALTSNPEVLLEFSNGEQIYYKNITGVAVYDGDMYLSESTNMTRLATDYANYLKNLQSQSIVADPGYSCGFICYLFNYDYKKAAWPNGKIYFTFDSSVTQEQRQSFNSAKNLFNFYTNNMPSIIEGTNPYGKTMKVQTGTLAGYDGGITPPGYYDQSNVRRLGLPSMLLSSGAYSSTALLLHEMGHAAGLMHEHQRCDRDNYVNIDYPYWSSISSAISGAFNYNKLCVMGKDSGPFDYNSIMMYLKGVIPKQPLLQNFTGSWQDTRIGNNVVFSRGDLNDGFRLLYPMPSTTKLDFVGLKRSNTSNGSVEVHVSNGLNDNQSFKAQSASSLSSGIDQADYLIDYNRDGTPDLVKLWKPLNGSVKINIVSGASSPSAGSYQSLLLNSDLPIDSLTNFDFDFYDWDRDGVPDLIAFKRSQTTTGTTEIHVLSGSSQYRNFLRQSKTVFGIEANSARFRVADWDGDGSPDLFLIKTQNTSSGWTEVHISTGASNYDSFAVHSQTALHLTDANWDFSLDDYNFDGKIDVVGIAKNLTGSGKAELHVLNGGDTFKTFLAHRSTVFPQDNTLNWTYAMMKNY